MCFPFSPAKRAIWPPPISGTIPRSCLCLLVFFSPEFRSVSGPFRIHSGQTLASLGVLGGVGGAGRGERGFCKGFGYYGMQACCAVWAHDKKLPCKACCLVAHDCGYPLSRYTCRATRVAADSLDLIAFCRCSTGVALHPLKILVSHPPPPPCAGRCRTEIWVWKGVALHRGVAATVAGVALHCATTACCQSNILCLNESVVEKLTQSNFRGGLERGLLRDNFAFFRDNLLS